MHVLSLTSAMLMALAVVEVHGDAMVYAFDEDRKPVRGWLSVKYDTCYEARGNPNLKDQYDPNSRVSRLLFSNGYNYHINLYNDFNCGGNPIGMVQPILAMKDYELDLEVPFKIGGEANFVKAYKTVKQPCSKGFDFVQVSGTCERKK